ncbi:uncharacterized protein LOC129890621 [Solanum dulcamara]|uniref:uncharacterized protein LOC129890621 n=1 Tax=Solanum dulcamara TaxID=45834 RepID=UPI00248674FF|nr:uncharacterized protein LOC129890621 [Solanum dulcamara]
MDFQTAITMLVQVVSNQGVAGPPNVPTPASMVRDFEKMNPPEFYSLKVDEDPQEFIDEYAPSLVADPRDQMSQFISGVSNLVAKKFHTTMLIKKMEISRHMTFIEKIEGEKLKEMRMSDSKRARYKCGFLKARYDGGSGLSQQGQGSRKKFINDKVPYPKAQTGDVNASSPSFPKCAKCRKNHGRRCLMETSACFG